MNAILDKIDAKAVRFAVRMIRDDGKAVPICPGVQLICEEPTDGSSEIIFEACPEDIINDPLPGLRISAATLSLIIDAASNAVLYSRHPEIAEDIPATIKIDEISLHLLLAPQISSESHAIANVSATAQAHPCTRSQTARPGHTAGRSIEAIHS
jgi:hypothetical protein